MGIPGTERPPSGSVDGGRRSPEPAGSAVPPSHRASRSPSPLNGERRRTGLVVRRRGPKSNFKMWMEFSLSSFNPRYYPPSGDAPANSRMSLVFGRLPRKLGAGRNLGNSHRTILGTVASVAVALPHLRTEPEHEMCPLKLLHPVLQAAVELVCRDRRAGDWARSRQLLCRQ